MKRARLLVLIISIITQPLFIPASHAATIYTFTTAGATGNQGPTQSQINTAYTSTNLSGQVTINTQGIQEWSVPYSGQYRITAKGAAGGTGYYGGNQSGGYGAQTVGTFTLTAGTVLKILVGQRGASRGTNGGAGGGGGTFVVTSTSTILTIAGGGGGGGGRNPSVGINASLTTTATQDGNAQGTAGTSGGGGEPVNSTWAGGGGGGYSGNGIAYGNSTNIFGYSFTNGGVGGAVAGTYGGAGGFGGGGGVGYAGGGGGGYNGAPGGVGNEPYPGGGGGSTFNSGSNITTTQLNTLADGGVTIEPLGPSLVTFSPRSTITNQTTIIFDITFSEAVTGLDSSDFSKSGTGSASCTIGSPVGTGTTYTVTLSGCSPGTIVLTMASGAATNTSSQTVPSSNTAAGTVTIDQTAPTITAVTAPANSTYIPTNTPTFTIVFSESVTVVGSPRLQLTVGTLTKYANYSSMSDSKTALFRYTVGTSSGEFDTDGIEVNTTFDFNGGRVDDLASNSMSLANFTAPVLTSVLVAQKASAPTISSIIPGNTQLTVNFSAGASNGSTITNYKYSLNGGSFTAFSPSDTVTPLVITGLTNGTSYTVRILAVTLAGDGDSSTAVTETPSAINVSGDSIIVLTYGTSGSTGSYSASGGTNTFTWSLGSTIAGVSLVGTTVNISSTLDAGTYTQTVRATDGASAVGSAQLIIRITKAASTLTLALQGGGSSTPVGQSPIISITTQRGGTVVFSAGGQVIGACASISIASTTGTCTLPAPNTTGSISLDAVFTPTSGNYDTVTATISFTIVNGIASASISLAGGVNQAPKGQAIVITANIDQSGKITFYVDGIKIPGCINRSVSVGNVTCSWKPAVQKQVTLKVTLNPTSNIYQPATSTLKVFVTRRTGAR